MLLCHQRVYEARLEELQPRTGVHDLCELSRRQALETVLNAQQLLCQEVQCVLLNELELGKGVQEQGQRVQVRHREQSW